MEKIFSPAMLAGFAATGILCVVIPVILFIFLRKKTRASFVPLIAGMLLYFAVSLLRALIRANFLRDDAVSFYFQQALLSGILEEGARFLAFAVFLKNYESREDSLSYGIGHGFYEIFSAGTLYLGYLITGLEYNMHGFSRLTAGNTPEESERMHEYVTYVSGINPLFQLAGSLSAAVFHIAMSVLIFYGIRTGKIKIILPAAIAIHTFDNFLCAIAPFGMEVFFTAFFAAIMGYAAYILYGRLHKTTLYFENDIFDMKESVKNEESSNFRS